MDVHLAPQLYAVIGALLLFVWVFSLYNFWKAPASVGHREALIVSVTVLGAGMALKGLERMGSPPIDYVLGDYVPDVLILSGMAIFLYVSLRVRKSLKDRRGPRSHWTGEG